jgi:hypothetical protein
MKYQFQFAGVNLDRPVPQNQRRKRWVIFGLSLALASVCYWQYLHYLSHGSFFFMQIRQPVPAATAKPVPARTITAPVTAPAEEKMPATMKLAAESTIVAAATAVADAVKLPTVPLPQTEAVSQTVPTQQPATEAAPAQAQTMTIVSVVSPVATPAKPKAHRTKAPETPEQRLQRAGKMAMNNMLDQANRYPDAYGFTANDVFTETTVGDPIPVYTVAEKDRAAYQAGQPIEKILKPANRWVFPVFAGARLCCMVEVTYNGHEYIPGNASKFLAMAWDKIADHWPASEGYHPRLVVNPDLPGYYFSIPEHPMPNVTDTCQMFYLHPSLSPADVILASWR